MAVIQNNNISGRAVGVILKEKPFLHTYPDGVSRMSYDLWQLCHSPLINKWAKFSPLTANGGRWEAPSKATQPYDATDQWYYQMPSNLNYDANLAQFGNYTDSFIYPASIMFPEQLWSDIDNMLSIGVQFGTPYIYGIDDAYPNFVVDGKLLLYPCACLSNDKGMYNWAAGEMIPLLPGSEVFSGKVTFCLSDTKKDWRDPNVQANFYSLNFDGTQPVSKTLPIKASSGGGGGGVGPGDTSDLGWFTFAVDSMAIRDGVFGNIVNDTTQMGGLYLKIGNKKYVHTEYDFKYTMYEVEYINGKWTETGAKLTGNLSLSSGTNYEDFMCTTFTSARTALQTLMIKITATTKGTAVETQFIQTIFPISAGPRL